MKNYLLITLLFGLVSLSHAGGICGYKSSDSSEKACSHNTTQSSFLLVKSCGSCGGCGGDKSDKSDKSGKSSLDVTSMQFAGSCDDDEEGKKCGSKSLISA